MQPRLIALIAHPAEVLSSSNMQHRRILAAVASGDEGATAREMAEHLRGTEHMLAGCCRAAEALCDAAGQRACSGPRPSKCMKLRRHLTWRAYVRIATLRADHRSFRRLLGPKMGDMRGAA